jgi:serine protease Do
MTRIRWYGPTLVLLTTCLIVMLAGPAMVRRLSWHQVEGRIELARDSNTGDISLAAMSQAFRNVAKVVKPSVVHIQVEGRTRKVRLRRQDREEQMRRWFFDRRRRPPSWHDDDSDERPEDEHPQKKGGDEPDFRSYTPMGAGSGWVFDEQHIVTNNHVVEEGDKITVVFSNESKRTAKVVGKDPDTDIAVLRVAGGGLHPAEICSVPVEQGEIVFAFGSPFGFEFSMSQGIVSAKGRKPGIVRAQGYENFIQSDAAINRGNSGGPLTNIYGEVVGMNTAIATRGNPEANFNGIGFAIPAAMIRKHVTDLIAEGKVVRGFLGVQIMDLDENKAYTFGYDGKGVLVYAPMEGSPAQDAGVRPDDIIIKINDVPVSTMEQLRHVVAAQAPGAKVNLEIFRGTSPNEPGETLNIAVEIVEKPTKLNRNSFVDPSQPDEPKAEPDPKIRDHKSLRHLGLLRVVTASRTLMEHYERAFVEGVLVTKVADGSPAQRAGIREGAIITRVFAQRVKDVDELIEAIAAADVEKPIRLRIDVGEAEVSVFLEPSDTHLIP